MRRVIASLLIANRGEIARRIIRTARSMGIRTIAVHSDADAGALFVREADEAVHIGPSPARESYLDQAKILAAAKASSAEAIHPGYGFLSENADFADAVIAAGIVWVGAPPAAIRAMGLKDAAKALMQLAGVPVTPGYLGEDQSPERLRAEADAIGYPVLIKAVAGGGGKGMRRVDQAADFADALASCRREAAAAFGEDRVLLEKYVLNPRHIEVQVFGDQQGNVVHLFERDCSLQRRHQKVIEEAPAPGMDETTRAAICGAAVKAAQAVDYVGAGTIEFIVDASDGLRADRIWFMEMNTRLQVEHPVTEAITGQDLVEWQLRVASGEPLPKTQHELTINGHAVEARLYAEDPAKGFLPSVGPLDIFAIPAIGRIEAAVGEGDRVTPYYDPMIAKLIRHGETRTQAIDGLAEMLAGTRVWPVRTNAGYVRRALLHPAFKAGRIDTGFLEATHDALLPSPEEARRLKEDAALVAVDANKPTLGIWGDGFRLNAPGESGVFLDGERVMLPAPRPIAATPREGGIVAFTDGDAAFFALRAEGQRGAGAGGDGAILAPMPGRIVSVAVAANEEVTAGQTLVVIEAMKMEQALVAPFAGRVAELAAIAGGQTTEGALLARIAQIEP
jgi:3-methylcrotonyl-CoA carboxylase alpha subunit